MRSSLTIYFPHNEWEYDAAVDGRYMREVYPHKRPFVLFNGDGPGYQVYDSETDSAEYVDPDLILDYFTTKFPEHRRFHKYRKLGGSIVAKSWWEE